VTTSAPAAAPGSPVISTIYRIVASSVWAAARQVGTFEGTAHDRRDGFIHFSTATQLAETAARHYAGQRGLLLLYVRTAEVEASLRWEPARGGALFPHLHAPLSCAAVHREEPLTLGEDGLHVLPGDLFQES